MLSEKDTQQLAAIELELIASDPRFVSRMRTAPQVDVPITVLAGLWLASLVVTAACGWVAVAAMAGCLVALDIVRRVLRRRLRAAA